jgi:rusticyanin
MRGGSVPRPMMGASHDPGKVMGRLWADAPGPRVSAREAVKLGGQSPAGASVRRDRHTITFAGADVHLVAVASPAGGPDETFRIAGMVNPTITVPVGARISVQVINADPDTAHGLVVAASGSRPGWMPMMTAASAFPGSALWFLGNPTSAGMHEGTITFTAATPGTYAYLCPVPGHAQKGMTGRFTVAAR